MRKIIMVAFLISLCLLNSCSCKQNSSKVHIYDEESKWEEYLEMFYKTINTEGEKYVAIDLRTKELYETEHLSQFQNFNLSKSTFAELNNWLTSNYSNKHSIYIYVDVVSDRKSFDSLLETYKEVYVFVGDYSILRTKGDNLFIFDSGPYDCNC